MDLKTNKTKGLEMMDLMMDLVLDSDSKDSDLAFRYDGLGLGQRLIYAIYM